MTFEVNDDVYPATAVVYIEAKWGARSFGGSGFLVGRNDVITAAHVIYDVALGGWADSVTVFPSYDPDDRTNARFTPSWMQAFPDFDPDGDGRLITGDLNRPTQAGSEKDIALLSFSTALGDQYGWFGIDWGYQGGTVNVIGYPAVYGWQPMSDSGAVRRDRVDGVFLVEPSLEINGGNSGGPLFYTNSLGSYAVGVVSTRIAATALGAHQWWLPEAMRDNDSWLDGIAISATAADRAEGTGAITGFTFTVSRSQSTREVGVDWAVAGAGSNPASAADFNGYSLPSGRLTLARGETAKTITVGVVGEATVEADESFTVTLSNPQGINLGAASATGWIRNDDVRSSNRTGSPFDDVLQGLDTNDTLRGERGSDLLEGLRGNDTLNGGPGTDTAVFSGNRTLTTISYNAGSRSYTLTGPDGTDTLTSVEKLRFADGERWIEEAAGLTGVVHRFFNERSGMHFVTASNAEANWVRSTLPQFDHEGLAFRTAASGAAGSTDVFRFFNAQTQAHFYTVSAAERDWIRATLPQFQFEGTGFRAYGSDRGPQEELYRFFNTQTQAHFFTTVDAERDWVYATLPQFRYEGVAFFVDVV